ncbi:MAG: helix-turn-helix domain-containing protein [Bacillota bacterium]
MKELAGKKGFHAVTTDELAAAAGVSKRTLCRYFAGKDEIIEAVLDDMITGVERRGQSTVLKNTTLSHAVFKYILHTEANSCIVYTNI